MSETKFMKLGEVCRVYQPETIAKKSLPADGTFPVYGANGKIGLNDRYNHEEPQLLLGCRGSVGSVHISEPFSWINGNAMVVQAFETIITRDYLKYAFLGGININDAISGTAQPQITRESLSPIQIFVPSLEKQREIVEKLDSAFAEIDLLEENLGLSDKKTNQLIQSMLSAALGLSGEQLANFESLEGDTINIVKLSEACTFSRGLTYGKSDEVEFSSNVVLRANNIDLASNSLNLADLRFIKDSIRIKKEKIAKKDSIIICTASGSKSHVGKVALIDQDYGYAYGGFMGQLTPSDNCLSKYLYFILTSGTFKDFLMKLNDGTNINNLKFSDIEDYEFPLPTLEKQRVIVSKLDNAFAEIEKIKNQIAIKQDFAGMLRQSLLSDSFSPNLEKESV
jgi:type I restriction enzyme S subunit